MGWGIFENISVDSDSMDRSDVNETADKYIVWNHLTRGYFLMIVYNQYNQIAADQYNVWNPQMGGG